jgi:hypothetical protein
MSRFFSRLGRLMLISHIRVTEAVLACIVLGVALYLGVILFYVPPAQVEVLEPRSLKLNTASLDYLASWQRQREEARRSELLIPASTLFP